MSHYHQCTSLNSGADLDLDTASGIF